MIGRDKKMRDKKLKTRPESHFFVLHIFVFLTTVVVATADSGPTKLHKAVYRDDTKTSLILIQSGTDPDAKNAYGVTALFLACQNGNGAIVEALLTAGADPAGPALLTAARTGRPKPVTSLIQHGANVNFQGKKGQTALIHAASEGHDEVVQLLIDAGADPTQKLESGFTPLLFAARNGKSEVVKVLLKAGAKVNEATQTDSKGKAPPKGTAALRIAVENGHFDLAALLLESGADPDDQRSGHTPLHVLTWVRKPNRGDGNDGLPPPRGSGKMTSLEFARLLIEKHKADVNSRLKNGSSGGGRFGTRNATPFLLAAQKADLPYLKLLKELGADHNIPNQDGTTAFLAVSGVGSRAPEEEAGTETERLATLTWLQSLGCEINLVNKNGETAMHGAAYKNIPEVARWLASQGAEINIWNKKNKRGWTPLLIAQGFRPGNFKPSAATIEAIKDIMKSSGVTPPPAPVR